MTRERIRIHQEKPDYKTIVVVVGISILAIAAFIIPQQLVQAAKRSSENPGAGQLLPDIRPVASTLEDNDLVKDPHSGNILLRFAGGIGNYGAGTLEVYGKRDVVDRDNNTMPAYQRVYNADGSYIDRPVGMLIYHPLHHHYHFVGSATYSLIDPSNGNEVVKSEKQTFCLADVTIVDTTVPNYTQTPKYNSCAHSQVATSVLMGVSPGWEDVYGKDLVGQAFNVTDLMHQPPKTYILQQTTNPEGLLLDANGGIPQTITTTVVIGQGVHVGTGVSRPGV